MILNVATAEASSRNAAKSEVPSSETVPDETTLQLKRLLHHQGDETAYNWRQSHPLQLKKQLLAANRGTTTQEITTPSNNSTPLRDSIVNYALGWVGQCNYVYGGTDLSIGGSVDCSGFTMQVYSRVAGVSLPHHSMSQMNCGSAITYDQLRPGDLVFYNNPNHVAIYIGNGAIVHAGSPETGINVTSVFFKTPIGYRTYLP